MRLGAEEPLCVCVCVCIRTCTHMHAPNLTRYHMKMVLKAFSLEQDPQAIVMSWDIPLGATCGEGNSPGLSLLPPAGPPHAGREPGMESWTQSDWEGEREAQKGLDAGGQRGEKVNKAHRSLVMALPATACTFYRWEVRIPKDTDHCGH